MLNFLNSSRKNPQRASHDLVIDGAIFRVDVVNNSKSKRLTLRLKPDGRGARVTTPMHVGEGEIVDFIERNRNWIAVRLARLPSATRLHDGALIAYRGIDHKIIAIDRQRGVVEAKVIDGEPGLLVPGGREHMPRRIIDFMKKQARQQLNIAVNQHAASLNVRPNRCA